MGQTPGAPHSSDSAVGDGGCVSCVGSGKAVPTSAIRSTSWWLALAALVLAALVMFVPWRPVVSVDTLDASWAMGLNDAFATGKRFGQTIVFTMGPYGFLYPQFYHPATIVLLIASWVTYAVAMALLLWAIARRYVRSPAVAAAWAAAIMLVVQLVPGFLGVDAFMIVFAAAFLVWYRASEGRPRWAAHAVVAMFALASLVKHTFAALAVLALVAVALQCIGRRRSPLPFAATYAGTLVVLWLGAGQRLQDIYGFVRGGYLIAAGYNEAMSRIKGDPVGCLLEVLLYGAGAALLVAAIAVRREGERRTAAAAKAALAGALLFMVFKIGFVSHNTHGIIATFSLLAMALVIAPALWSSGRRLTRGLLIAAIVASVGCVAADVSLRKDSMPTEVRNTPRKLATSAGAALEMISGRSDAGERLEQACAMIRRDNPLPAIKGTVDIYPHNQAVVLAWGLRYEPRPVFQSYSAYLPALAEMNAAHLRSDDAPETILFNVVDQKGGFLPAIEDGLSWLEILGRYRLRSREGSYLLFERSEPRRVTLVPKGAMTAAFGEWISLPDTGAAPVLSWAKVRFAPTALGRAMKLLYRVPVPTITVRTADGREGTWRLVAATAGSGFLLSPLVTDAEGFAAIAGGRGAQGTGATVTAIRFAADGGADATTYYEDRVTIELFDVAIE